MRYRTATILSIVLIGGMFAVPAVIEAVFLPSLKQGIPNPLPGYEQILLCFSRFFPWLAIRVSSSDCGGALHRRGVH